MIPKKLYTKILASVPILCVDIILKRKDGKYLLVKRTNEPYKNRYWVIGGRVLKGEQIEAAMHRKLSQEVGLIPKNLSFTGYYNGIYTKNEYGLDSIHTVSLVFTCTDFTGEIKLDDQSSSYKWADALPKLFTVRK